jgi:hypothetical protein
MPGAPNRPPEADLPPPPPPAAGTPADRVLRRLAPSRIALHLDLWRGAPSKELLQPLESAEASFAAGDIPHAEGALDQLAVRFAEPRWPTLPVPFKGLRQEIPPPMPPHWDPEHGLPVPEREARKMHRFAELQLQLADACVGWASAHGIAVTDLAEPLESARRRFPVEGASASYWTDIDRIWIALRERVPMPKVGGAARPSAAQ